MSRLNVVLALVLVACALAVIQAQHRARTYFVELERLKKEARVLDEQWGQLQLEQGTWANPARVDTLARTRLGLIAPPHDRVRIETLTNAP
ncbi:MULTISPECIES: cell division protein FtsL [Thiobacillus]|jgi:cell division protein FtsL|uniref:cell division protein FtsL n=1 Tax=Thiobacillus TaxID=919 RepID=UPI00036D4ABF|nr:MULTISPECIES: cell division protein FtsL [Thiobacillus]MBD3812238.1 cell division protein FtsL [Betaproteobacteria bacterium]ODU05634.1 MAG: cell division protein FtsL [Thiobacillus sp. SCN 63-1177]MBC2729703.1 cell division protein FtsL [Thiobacillus sp.]MBC2738438.1 cell division protein FtsL [Thiobacillus sp.]MBC2761281.1 cell division protein FtsL [Thiobacillus sp.]